MSMYHKQQFKLTSISAHLLLCDEDLLGAVDDEVGPRVQRALVKLSELVVVEARKQAEL